MRSTMVARIAIAVRPNSGEPLGPTEAVGTALGSADTVGDFRESEVAVELAGNPKPFPGSERVFSGKRVDPSQGSQ